VPREPVGRLSGIQRRLVERFCGDCNQLTLERTRDQMVARAWIRRSHPSIIAHITQEPRQLLGTYNEPSPQTTYGRVRRGAWGITFGVIVANLRGGVAIEAAEA